MSGFGHNISFYSVYSLNCCHAVLGINSNFGKLNYFLGKRAADEGRESKYPDVDFCKDPGESVGNADLQCLSKILFC